jgi:hypothetical protein
MGVNYMKYVIDWTKINDESIYTQLKKRLGEQKEEDTIDLPKDNNALQRSYLDQDYKIYDAKLNFVDSISTLDKDLQEDYIRTLVEIDCTDYPLKEKLLMMLSYGNLIHYFKDIKDKTYPEKFMISASAIDLDHNDYQRFITVLNNKKVSQNIVNASDDIYEQMEIAFDIMDKIDNSGCKQMKRDSYRHIVKDSLNLVEDYPVLAKTRK